MFAVGSLRFFGGSLRRALLAQAGRVSPAARLANQAAIYDCCYLIYDGMRNS